MLQPTTYNLPTNKGFTLLEMLLSISTIAILAGLSLPVFQTFQTRNDLDIAAETFAQTARRAQVLSQGVASDTTWGAAAQSGSITLFQGASYAARDQDFDEVFDVPASITLSGGQEFVFAKFTGLPAAAGTLTFTSVTNEERTITINAKGMVSY